MPAIRRPRASRLALGVGIVVLLAVVGDQGARALAQSHSARHVSCELRATHSTVSIAGPFLVPQLIRGRFTHVVTRSQGVRQNGVAVDLVSDLHDVHVVSAQRVTSGAGRISVTIPMSQISAQAGAGLVASGEHGVLVLTVVSGDSARYGTQVFTRVTLDHNDLVFTPYRVKALGDVVPLPIARRQAKKAGQSLAPQRFRLPTLLTDLGLQPPVVSATGLQLEATGSHFTLSLPDVPGC